MLHNIFTLEFLVSLLAGTIRLATPILLPALGQIYTQRAGILNLGVEGTMLMGALSAFSVALSKVKSNCATSLRARSIRTGSSSKRSTGSPIARTRWFSMSAMP